MNDLPEIIFSSRRDDSREAVLGAALEVLSEVGYNRLRTKDVATRSGLSEGTLFHYFSTKHLLVAAAAERVMAVYVDRSTSEFGALEPPYDRRRLLVILWNLLSDKRMSWTFELFAALKTDPLLREFVGPVLVANAKVIDELAAVIVHSHGGVPKSDASVAVSLCIWGMQGLVLRDMSRGESGLHEDLIDYLLFLLDNMYPLDK
jgi:AcrR family transcriptional regulator